MKLIQKLALLFFATLTLIACGGASSGGGSAGGNTGGGGNPDGNGGGGTPNPTKIRISEATGDEGKNITFRVTSSQTIAKAISFSYRIDFAGQTASADDLSSDIAGSSTIAASSDSTTISILIKDDDINEPAETFRITLSNLAPSDATFTKNTAIGTISASDPTEISIAPATAEEGSTLMFTVTSERAIAEIITFSYNVSFDNPATAVASDLSGQQLAQA